ncbi:hypothetical protein ACLOJK_035059 [Asimina triloba]
MENEGGRGTSDDDGSEVGGEGGNYEGYTHANQYEDDGALTPMHQQYGRRQKAGKEKGPFEDYIFINSITFVDSTGSGQESSYSYEDIYPSQGSEYGFRVSRIIPEAASSSSGPPNEYQQPITHQAHAAETPHMLNPDPFKHGIRILKGTLLNGQIALRRSGVLIEGVRSPDGRSGVLMGAVRIPEGLSGNDVRRIRSVEGWVRRTVRYQDPFRTGIRSPDG